jgi:hypothetical protein
MCTLLVGTAARTSAGVALQVPAGSAQGEDTPVPESKQLRRHLDTGDLRARGWTLEGFYFYLKSPLLPSLSPASLSAVLLSPWLEIVSLCITMASLGTFPFLQLLGNVSPVCMDGLRSFLNEQARIKACASAPISLLPSSALRR